MLSSTKDMFVQVFELLFKYVPREKEVVEDAILAAISDFLKLPEVLQMEFRMKSNSFLIMT